MELNDGGLPGSPRYDKSGARLFCGDGEYDIKGFIKTFQNMGYVGPWAVEVFNPNYVEWSLDEVTTKAFDTTIAEFKG